MSQTSDLMSQIEEALGTASDEPEELDSDGETIEEELVIDEESPNVVPDLMNSAKGEAFVQKAALEIHGNFQAAWDANKDARDRFSADYKMFIGKLPKKTFPYENCANLHIPISMENISRVHCRIYSEIFGDPNNVVGFIGGDPDSKQIADALTQHTHWQIEEQIQDFYSQMWLALLLHIMIGDWTCQSYYSEQLGRNVHEVLTVDQFVAPFTHTSRSYDYSECPFYARVMQMYDQELEQYSDSWYGISELLDKDDAATDDEVDQPGIDVAQDLSGKRRSDEDSEVSREMKPRTIIWYEGWMRLPGHQKLRWVKAIYAKKERKLLLLSVHERQNWRDARRFRRQSEQLQQWKALRAQYEQESQQYQSDKIVHDTEIETVRSKAEQSLSMLNTAPEQVPVDMLMSESELDRILARTPQEPSPLPPPPNWLKGANPDTAEPAPVRMEPIRLFVHGKCMEAPAGPVGFGPGGMLADYVRAGNTIANQFVDAATQSNAPGFIARDGVEFSEKFTSQPGKINYARNMPGKAIADDIIPVPHQPANPQMMEILKLVMDSGQAALQAPDVLSGDPGKSGESFRGINLRVEQAVKQISVWAMRFVRPLRQVFINNSFLNSIHMDETEFFEVVDPSTKMSVAREVDRSWYEGDFLLKTKTDLKFSSQAQRVIEADEALKMALENPMTSMDQPLIWELTKESFVARGMHDKVPLLGPPPPPPMLPFGAMPPPVPPVGPPAPPPPPPPEGTPA